MRTPSSRDDTRRRILPAGGRIFAQREFDAATIKQITSTAKANVAAVNYPFGSKRKFYLEVLRLALPDRMQSYLEDWLSIADLVTGWMQGIHRDLGEWTQYRIARL
jgi:AcrR family transcriptional regulator